MCRRQIGCLISMVILLVWVSVVLAGTVPEEARRFMARGIAAVEMAKSPEDYEQAIKEFQQAARLAPDWPDPYNNLGFVQSKAGHTTSAIKSYQRYLDLAPGSPDAAKVREEISKLEYRRDREGQTALQEESNKYIQSLKTTHKYFEGVGLQIGFVDGFYQPPDVNMSWRLRAEGQETKVKVKLKDLVKDKAMPGMSFDMPLYIDPVYALIGSQLYFTTPVDKVRRGYNPSTESETKNYQYKIDTFARYDFIAAIGWYHPYHQFEVHAALAGVYEHVDLEMHWDSKPPKRPQASQHADIFGGGPRVGASAFIAPRLFLGIEGFGYFGGMTTIGGQINIGLLLSD